MSYLSFYLTFIQDLIKFYQAKIKKRGKNEKQYNKWNGKIND